MRKLSILKKFIGYINKGRTAALAAIIGASLIAASPVGATSLDENSKIAVGEANAETNATADPIRPCGPVPPDRDASAWGKYFKVNGVNMHRSPSTHSTSCAQGQKSHRVDYHCWKVGADGHTWTYVRDVTTHYAGWVRDNLLVGNGSLVRC